MKTGSAVLYTIGRIFNIIAMLATIVLIIVGIVSLANTQAVVQADTSGQLTTEVVKATGTMLLIVGIITTIILIVAFVVAGFAKKALNDGKKNSTPHIIMLIIGIISGDLFYLIGAILGLVSDN